MEMELRRLPYRTLVNMLKDAGVYEEGMNYEELKQLAQVLEQSARQQQMEENEEYRQFERARCESELYSLQSVDLHQSTMLTSPDPFAWDVDMQVGVGVSQPIDCDSPPSEPIRLTVRVLVHHPHDWSPTDDRPAVPKRKSDENIQPIDSEEKRIRCDNKNNDEAQQQQPPAAAEGDVTPQSLASEDSGVSWDELSSLHSSAYDSATSSVPSIGEMPSGLMASTSSAVVSDSSPNSSNEMIID